MESGIACACVPALLVVGLCAGCLVENPQFDPLPGTSSAHTDGTSGTSGPSGTGETTGVDTDDAGGTSAGGTLGSEGTTSATLDTVAPGTTSGSTGEGLEFTVELAPDEVGCVVLPMGDEVLALPAECEAVHSAGNDHGGLGEMAVDLATSDFNGREARGLLRFPWDPALDGATLVSAQLVLHATDHDGQADSEESGSVWASEPFAFATLTDSAPALVGQEPLSPSQGMVKLDEVVAWELPVDALVAGQPLHLQLRAESDDGVHYWNAMAPDPAWTPRLEVVALP